MFSFQVQAEGFKSLGREREPAGFSVVQELQWVLFLSYLISMGLIKVLCHLVGGRRHEILSCRMHIGGPLF